ncbi:hypothetical protein F503_07735 [Ophiostoma piceae UAMH 11346]|uniref:NAD-specific glutamate dehydrogenase n=1 Tax=Ophiostoma piceae (strain UAMH 11346) TaxID=1262450 RepID=S3BSJ8_OPHP1|nr:hypothetical protein F503_07735 [Ophiostoma piceae UAMH 11346]
MGFSLISSFHSSSRIALLELPAVRRLVAAHLDLDGHRRLAALADLDLLVLALNRRDAADADDLLLLGCRVRLDDGERRVHAQVALHDIDADDDRRGLVEHGHGAQHAREHGQHLGLLLLLLAQQGHVLREGVEQVVDNVGREDLDVLVVGILRRLLVDLDVEAQHHGVVGRLLQHHTALHDVALVHRADADVGHGDLAVLQEVQQRLERAQRRRLHADAAARLLDTVEHGRQVALDLLLQVLLVVVLADDQQARAGNGALETRGADLDTHGGLDLLVVHVRRAHAQLAQRRRRQQRTNVCLDDTLDTAQDNAVALAQDTVGQDDVDGHAETLNGLDLQHGGLHLGQVHERVGHALLGQLHEQLQHVGDTLAGVGRRGHQRDVARHVLVLVEELGVEALLGERDLGGLETLGKLVLHAAVLQRQTVLEAVVVDLLPAVQTIDLVERHNKGRAAVAQHAHGLERLRLEAVHDVDDEDRNVAQRRTTRAQVGERLVTGRVDDQQAGHLEVERAVLVDDGRLLLDGVDGEVRGADLLRDATSFALLDVGLAHLVEQLGLAGVDVAHDAADGRAQVIAVGSGRGPGSLVVGLLLRGGLALFGFLGDLLGVQAGALRRLGQRLLLVDLVVLAASAALLVLRGLLGLGTAVQRTDLDAGSHHLLQLLLVAGLGLLLCLGHVLALLLELLNTLLLALLLHRPLLLLALGVLGLLALNLFQTRLLLGS